MSVQPAAAPAAASAPTPAPAVEDGDDLIVSIPDTPDAVIEDEVVQQSAPAPPVTPAAPVVEPTVTPTEGLEDLKKQLGEREQEAQRLNEQNRRLAADRAAAMAMAEDLQRRGVSTEEALIESQLATATASVDSAKRDYQAALEAGEYAKAADAQVRISEAIADRRSSERDKQSLNRRPAPVQPRQTSIDPAANPIDAAISRFSPTAQAWLSQHRDVFRPDGNLKRSAMDAHETAVDEGLALDTPAYFSRIEALLAPPAAPAPVAPVAPAAPARSAARPASMAAPVVRSAAPTSASIMPGADGSFRLTPKMRALAESAGAPDSITYADWAKQYIALVKSGDMQPITD